MARRRKKDDGAALGCLLLLGLAIISWIVEFISNHAAGFITVGAIIALVIAIAVFMNAESIQETMARRRRDSTAMARNQPALRLLVLLAHCNGSLSKPETDVIITYMITVYGFTPTPAFRRDIKNNVPSMTERQNLINQLVRNLNAEEMRNLTEQVASMKAAHKRRSAIEIRIFDDTLTQLGTPPAPEPVIERPSPTRPTAAKPPIDPYDISPV